jgi:hypothetical protein
LFGRAEWLKFVAAFFNLEEEANNKFDAIKQVSFGVNSYSAHKCRGGHNHKNTL